MGGQAYHGREELRAEPAAFAAPPAFEREAEAPLRCDGLLGGPPTEDRCASMSYASPICVSSRPGPSVVDLPVVLTWTRPNVSTKTHAASVRAIRPRNPVITG